MTSPVVETEVAAENWVDAWTRGWPSGDVDSISALYAEDARFWSQPTREPHAPREYLEWVFGLQASATCRFGRPIVQGDRAAVNWWAVIEDRDGTIETVAGTSLLRFASDGRTVGQRDAFGSLPGRVELPDWAC